MFLFLSRTNFKIAARVQMFLFLSRANFKIAAGVAVLKIRHVRTLKVLRVQMVLNNKQTRVLKSFSDIFSFSDVFCVFSDVFSRTSEITSANEKKFRRECLNAGRQFRRGENPYNPPCNRYGRVSPGD